MNKSPLISALKEHELNRLRLMTPEQRLKAQAALNARIKRLFIDGLSSQGFSGSEIARLWKERRNS